MWFHRKLRRWFEIDGYLMRADQRHKQMRGMKTITEMSYSDHKPLILRISTKMKKWRQGRRTTANIKWEALRHKEKAEEFRQRTAAIIEDDDFGATRSWNEVSSILVRAAKEVCGEQSKRVENSWIIGAEEQLAELRANINNWVQARNEATNNITHRIFKRNLTNARKTLKKKLKHLERE